MAESFVNVTEGSGKKLHAFQRTIGANTVEGQTIVVGEQYLAEYTVATVAQVTTATANSHLLQVMAGASNRLRIRRIEVSQSGLATTAAFMQVAIYRLTTAGTGGTSITPQLLDPADSAAGATAMTLATVKGTEGALLWTGSLYMQQTAGASLGQPDELMLDFDGLRRKPIHVAAGAANGIAIKNIDAVAAGDVLITVTLDESSFI